MGRMNLDYSERATLRSALRYMIAYLQVEAIDEGTMKVITKLQSRFERFETVSYANRKGGGVRSRDLRKPSPEELENEKRLNKILFDNAVEREVLRRT